jgi:hypothetical protein
MSSNLIFVCAISIIAIISIIFVALVKRQEDSSDDNDDNDIYDYFTAKNIKKLKIGPFLANDSSVTRGILNTIEPVKKIKSTAQRLYVYNPSIAYDKKGDIVGVSRLTGKIAKECSYYNDSDFKSDEKIDREMIQYKRDYKKDLSTVIMWKLNDLPNFTVVPLFSSDQICDNNEFLETSQGVEDPRLFQYGGDLWIYAHFRGFLGECTHSPIIMPAKEPFSVEKIIKLKTANMRYVEKNWMPFEYNRELYFVYDISPHIILKCDMSTGYCGEVYHSDNIRYDPIIKKHLGGGAPGVKILIKGKPYFLTLAHTRENNPVITRKNFFYLFRAVPPFDIVMIGSEFDIMEDYRSIEFGSGLLLSDGGKNVIVSAGISDCYSVMSEYPLIDVLSSLRHVGEL